MGGEDTRQAVGHLPGQSPVSLVTGGIDERGRIVGARGKRTVLKQVRREQEDAFRRQVELVELIGEDRDRSRSGAARGLARRMRRVAICEHSTPPVVEEQRALRTAYPRGLPRAGLSGRRPKYLPEAFAVVIHGLQHKEATVFSSMKVIAIGLLSAASCAPMHSAPPPSGTRTVVLPPQHSVEVRRQEQIAAESAERARADQQRAVEEQQRQAEAAERQRNAALGVDDRAAAAQRVAAQQQRRQVQEERRDDAADRRADQRQRRGGAGAVPAADARDAQRARRDLERDTRDAQRDQRDAGRDVRDAQRDARDAGEKGLVARLEQKNAKERVALLNELEAKFAGEQRGVRGTARGRLIARQQDVRKDALIDLERKQKTQMKSELKEYRAANPGNIR